MSETTIQGVDIHLDGTPVVLDLVDTRLIFPEPIDDLFSQEIGNPTPSVDKDANTPAYNFAQHVTKIREKGDALDVYKPYYDFTGGYGVPVVTGALWGNLAAAGVANGDPILRNQALGVPIVGAVLYSAVRTFAAEFRAGRRLNANLCSELGQKFELFKVTDDNSKTDEVVLRWCGPMEMKDDTGEAVPPLSVDESLELLAGLARDNNIRTVLIESDVLNGSDTDISSLAETEVDTAEWLKRKKHFAAKFKHRDNSPAVHTMLAFTPDALYSVAREVGRHPHQIKSLEGVINILREYAPEHPLIREFDDNKSRPALLMPNVSGIARRNLERNLNDVDTVFVRDDAGIPAREKVHMQGRVRDESVEWQVKGKLDRVEGLSSTLSLTKEDLEKILLNPDRYQNQQVITAAEYGAYLYANQKLDVQSEDEKPLTIQTDEQLQSQGIYALLARPRRIVKQGDAESAVYIKGFGERCSRMALAGAFAVGSVTVGVLSDMGVQHVKYGITQPAELKAAEQYGIDPSDLTKSQKQRIDNEALSQHPFVATLIKLDDARLWAMKLVGPDDAYMAGADYSTAYTGSKHNSSSVSGLSNGSSSVGNVTNQGKPVTEWSLTPHGNMSAAGYWANDTGNRLRLSGWTGDSIVDKDHVQVKDIPTLPLPDQANYIEVNRIVKPIPDGTRAGWWGDENAFIRLPVQKGTVPVAGDFGGSPFSLMARDNGTYVAALNDKQVDQAKSDTMLTYYVAPEMVTGPRTTAENNLDGYEYNRAAVQTEWRMERGDKQQLTDEERLKADVAHIKSKFEYSLAPLDRAIEDMVRTSPAKWANFVEEQSNAAKANCNVAATLIALDNPRQNVAWGYKNNGDTVLQSSEGHMWNVDAHGTIQDATPPSGLNAEARSSPDSGVNGWLLAGGGGLALAGVAGLRRKGAKGLFEDVSRGLASSRLAMYSTEELLRAKKVADTAAYAKEFSAESIRQGYPGVDNAATDRDKAIAKLGQHQVHSDHVRDSLREARLANDDRQERRLLRSAERVIGTIRRSGRARQLVQDQDISGLL